MRLVSEDHPAFFVVDGVLFRRSDNALICYPTGKPGSSYTIPDFVPGIAAYAFDSNYYLYSIDIPASVTSIDRWAFNYTKIASITIHNSNIAIQEGAFAQCHNLRQITLPSGLAQLSESLFNSCTSLRQVTIPDSVTSIGDYAFAGCSNLTSLVIPSSVVSIGDHVFDEYFVWEGPENLTLTVSPGSFAEQYCIDNDIPYTID